MVFNSIFGDPFHWQLYFKAAWKNSMTKLGTSVGHLDALIKDGTFRDENS